jgi:hypothetical protein
VVVERVVFGEIAMGPLTVRKMGGIADGFRMMFENDPTFVPGEPYLVFLREYDTPTKSGTERFWTITWMDRGVFASDGLDTWLNASAELRLSETDVEALARP